MTNITRIPVRFRPHLVTPSEAFAALELSNSVQRRVIEEQEERNRRNTYGAPVIMAIDWKER